MLATSSTPTVNWLPSRSSTLTSWMQLMPSTQPTSPSSTFQFRTSNTRSSIASAIERTLAWSTTFSSTTTTHWRWPFLAIFPSLTSTWSPIAFHRLTKSATSPNQWPASSLNFNQPTDRSPPRPKFSSAPNCATHYRMCRFKPSKITQFFTTNFVIIYNFSLQNPSKGKVPQRA